MTLRCLVLVSSLRQTTVFITGAVSLYICDTSDGKEGSRNRLFLHWFEKHAEPNRLTICTAHAQIEDEVVYAAIIVDNRNPKVNEITADFEKTSSLLADKP